MVEKLREPFEKFMDSPYYSEPELCGGVVTVSFSKQGESMNFTNGPRSCSAILKRVLLKRP
jgi:hypothetical protein